MEFNYHYYVTYTAAREARYDAKESLLIARAAQYVDECEDTVQTIWDTIWNNLVDTVEKLFGMRQEQEIKAVETWAAFHFLPGDFTRIQGEVDPCLTDRDYLRAHLICMPESTLVRKVVDDVKAFAASSGDATETLLRVGLTMHVLADTFAHQSFAGVPSSKINNVDHIYHCDFELDDEMQRAKTRTPKRVVSDRSFSFTGHGQADTWPDQPGETLSYNIAWRKPGKEEIVRYNPMEFYCAYLQMIDAMKYIKGGGTFSQNVDRVKLMDRTSGAWYDTKRAMMVFGNAGSDRALKERWFEYTYEQAPPYEPLTGSEQTKFRAVARQHLAFVKNNCVWLQQYLQTLV